jgi:exonuclease III
MSCDIKILSNNVKCLQNEDKQRKLFHYFNKSTDADIIMLQECHNTPADEKHWCSEWGATIKFSHGFSESRGLCKQSQH